MCFFFNYATYARRDEIIQIFGLCVKCIRKKQKKIYTIDLHEVSYILYEQVEKLYLFDVYREACATT